MQCTISATISECEVYCNLINVICLMSLRDIVLLLSDVENSSEMAINKNLDDCEFLQVFHLQKN